MTEEKGQKAITMWIDIDDWNHLAAMAKELGESKVSIVRRIIHDALKSGGDDAKERA